MKDASKPEIWMITFPMPGAFAQTARMIEASGFDGIGVVDTQNLAADPYSQLCLAAHATKHLKLRTSVTNPVTRHPAVTASAIATVQAESGGRAVLGIGRGDSAVAKIGERAPSSKDFARYISQVQGFLRGEEVTLDNGYRSRNEWIAHGNLPKVPVDVAATGPRVIEVGATLADSVTFAVGADPERLAWAIGHARKARAPAGLDPSTLKLGAYLNVVVHPEIARARTLARGTVGVIAHFSGMSRDSAAGMRPDDRAVAQKVGEAYDMSRHTRGDAGHAQFIDDAFIDRFAIAGPPAHCVERFETILKLGLDHLIVVGPGADVGAADQMQTVGLFAKEVLPVLKRA
ncbi:MAG: LLM class flavin-dependent oxidoreductase [Candidatus Binatus sp.]|uniref:LLM class flavin-dependent oxidoreductase n=1 Tax=Candidatus Binatus sp. TaxID=2811406 RepID=UPI003BB2099F